jgi:hypothetical protein
MKNRKDSFVIHISAPSDTVPYSFFYYAEKNELSLSVNKRLISLFSKNMARFETEEQAKEFLATVKQKPLWKYAIDKVSEYG